MFDNKLIAALLFNIIIAIGTFLVILSYFKTPEEKYEWARGIWKFKFFTTLSNVFSGTVALIMIPFEVVSIVKGNSEVPIIPLSLKYMGATVVTITFLTVLFFLGPTQGYKEMFGGTSFVVHLLGPILAFISFCFLEDQVKFNYLFVMVGMMPMVIYTYVYYRMVLIKGPLRGGWEDFYGFNVRNRWKISLVVMLLVNLLVSFGVLRIHNL